MSLPSPRKLLSRLLAPARGRRALSPRLEALEDRLAPATFTVRNTNNSGADSLRQAILDSNATPGPNTIAFQIGGGGGQTIRPTSALPRITQPVILDGTTEPGLAGSPLVVLNGGLAGVFANGLTLGAPNCTVRGLVIDGFAVAGIDVQSDGNLIAGNFLGTDVTGALAAGNAVGVRVLSAKNNTIGGTTAADRNLISGNTSAGVFVLGAPLNAPGNVVQGNYIGTDVTGTAALPNGTGVAVENGLNNLIGGPAPGAGNLISGNRAEGIHLFGGPDVGSSGNVVQGNRVGTDVSGTKALPNATGVSLGGGLLDLTAKNTVGGADAGAGNLLSGNTAYGVLVQLSNANLIEGNRVGTDATGAKALPNATGVSLRAGASNNSVGGTASVAAHNVISGNSNFGVELADPSTQGNVLQGNLIGTDVSGTAALRNSYGVYLSGASKNLIGGTAPPARNLISGNLEGVVLFSANANAVQGNFIGTDGAGLAHLGNLLNGVDLLSGSDNTVGGTTAGARNLISGNAGNGAAVLGSANRVQGNYLGTNLSGAAGLANGTGLYVSGPNNTLGGAAGAGNFVSGNATGIELFGGGATGNLVQGNTVGTDTTGTKALGNGVGISVDGGTNDLIGGTQAELRNLVSGNTGAGIRIQASGILVQGNFIGTDLTGTKALPNGSYGVQVPSGATNNTVGGTEAGSGNLISGNYEDGVLLSGDNNLVQGNYIGTDVTGTAALGNRTIAVYIFQGGHNTVGGTAPGAKNLISGNTSAAGVEVFGGFGSGGAAPDNVVQGNYIGTDITGTKALGNARGVYVGTNGAGTTVGGAAAGAGNLISGNSDSGAYLSAPNITVQGNRIGTDASGAHALGNEVDGVFVGADNDLIGGTADGAGNLISGNKRNGVELLGPNNTVEGNRIGTDASGTQAVGNAFAGVFINHASNNHIGTPSAGNLLSGNGSAGVYVLGTNATATGNLIQGNRIGTDASGFKALGNSTGVVLDSAPDNTVGGTEAGAGNLISGNKGYGIDLFGTANANAVQGNTVGADVTGAAFLGNGGSGVAITGGAHDNTTGGLAPRAGNVIAYNGNDGVLVDGGAGNAILHDAIFGNGNLGLELLDGGNNDQPAPTVTSAVSGGGQTNIQVDFSGLPSTAYTLELFVNSDPSNPQGERFLVALPVSTGPGGVASFTVSLGLEVPAGEAVTATLTDPAGNTSTFSLAVLVVPATS
jgi:hypothetical protein